MSTITLEPSVLPMGIEANANADIDPFESLLNLEETFYQQGYVLGDQDGARQGLVEGRIFGMERGFDKFSSIARLHGHSIVLGNRLPAIMEAAASPSKLPAEGSRLELDPELDLADIELLPLSGTARIEKHIRTLYALTEPASLSLQNNEDDVSEFDDRFKRAQAKTTILGKMVGFEIAAGEGSASAGKAAADGGGRDEDDAKVRGQAGEASIEDVSILQARH